MSSINNINLNAGVPVTAKRANSAASFKDALTDVFKNYDSLLNTVAKGDPLPQYPNIPSDSIAYQLAVSQVSSNLQRQEQQLQGIAQFLLKDFPKSLDNLVG